MYAHVMLLAVQALTGPNHISKSTLALCTGRLGGRCRCRIHRTDHARPVDVACAGFFINSTFSPILPFRRGLKSVGDVRKGMTIHGFLSAGGLLFDSDVLRLLTKGPQVPLLPLSPGPTGPAEPAWVLSVGSGRTFTSQCVCAQNCRRQEASRLQAWSNKTRLSMFIQLWTWSSSTTSFVPLFLQRPSTCGAGSHPLCQFGVLKRWCLRE